MTDKSAIRAIPVDLADIVDRPALKRVGDVDHEAQQRVRAEFAAREAADLVRHAHRLDTVELRDELERLQRLFAVAIMDLTTAAAAVSGRINQVTPRPRRRRRPRPRGIAVKVIKDSDGWVVVSREGARVGSPSYAVKKDAVMLARRVAREAKGTLSVYDLQGKVVEQHSYEPVVVHERVQRHTV